MSSARWQPTGAVIELAQTSIGGRLAIGRQDEASGTQPFSSSEYTSPGLHSISHPQAHAGAVAAASQSAKTQIVTALTPCARTMSVVIGPILNTDA
ncbi:MAG: hypothetical protein ACFCUN_10625 [Hyphomicrobiaceae bacterium]